MVESHDISGSVELPGSILCEMAVEMIELEGNYDVDVIGGELLADKWEALDEMEWQDFEVDRREEEDGNIELIFYGKTEQAIEREVYFRGDYRSEIREETLSGVLFYELPGESKTGDASMSISDC